MHQNISASKDRLRLIEQLDLQVWESWIAIKQGPDHSSSPIVYRCICPLCNGKTAKKQKSQSSSHSFTATVYRHRDGDGLGYSCAACKAHFPSVYHFLGPGSSEAEKYAQARFNAGCCGRGWSCSSSATETLQKYVPAGVWITSAEIRSTAPIGFQSCGQSWGSLEKQGSHAWFCSFAMNKASPGIQGA